MFRRLASYLMGGEAEPEVEGESVPAALEERPFGPTLRQTEGECDDWVIVEALGASPPPPAGLAPRLGAEAWPGMEESWFVTPPACFTSPGPVHVETSPLENLLIEHPSMSVYAGALAADEPADCPASPASPVGPADAPAAPAASPASPACEPEAEPLPQPKAPHGRAFTPGGLLAGSESWKRNRRRLETAAKTLEKLAAEDKAPKGARGSARERRCAKTLKQAWEPAEQPQLDLQGSCLMDWLLKRATSGEPGDLLNASLCHQVSLEHQVMELWERQPQPQQQQQQQRRHHLADQENRQPRSRRQQRAQHSHAGCNPVSERQRRNNNHVKESMSADETASVAQLRSAQQVRQKRNTQSAKRNQFERANKAREVANGKSHRLRRQDRLRLNNSFANNNRKC